MAAFKTIITYDDEGEVTEEVTFSSKVNELDPYSFLHYVQTLAYYAMYDCEELQMIASHGKLFKTDI